MTLFSTLTRSRFRFFDPGRLVDGELELVEPGERWSDDVLDSSHHPLTARLAPREAATTRQRLIEFLQAAPRGHEQGRATIGRVPSYHFWMRVRHAPDDRLAPPPLVIAGGIGLRIGMNHELEMYSGHLGYHVYPASRGNHYAERACRLLLPLARRHGIAPVWITCNPDNAASRRTCERLGAEFVETVRVPDSHEFFHRGERHKCRYRICL